MRERSAIVVTGLVLLMVLLWLGFLFHTDPRFAGSSLGGALAVVGSTLMLVPLFYSLIKRFRWIRTRVTSRVPMRTLLAWHIYAGVIGPILVVLHTGHKFESTLGIALTALTLIVVISGFIGRYLLSGFAREISEKRALLQQLQARYEAILMELRAQPAEAVRLLPFTGMFSRILGSLFAPTMTVAMPPAMQALRIANAIADVEYAVRIHETFKRVFAYWLKAHIFLSVALYTLLALHVWAAIHFGLRWFA
jgi:hypothetical protein